MTSFCRITGNARNLPKPCYFPLLPPISPADAKKLCRITGRATDAHHYSPIIAFAKPYRFDGLEGCKITKHENLNFTRPTFTKTKENEKSLDSLNELLSKMKAKRKKLVDTNRSFVYKITDQATSIVLPPELEEAIRTGEIESLSIHNDGNEIAIRISQGRLVKVKLETIPAEELAASHDNFYYGEGQSKEVVEEQQKILNKRNLKKQETMARKKLFEQKEKKAEEEERKAVERPKSKRPVVKFDPQKRKEKLARMEKAVQENATNAAIILPKFDNIATNVNPDEQIWYEQMLEDIAKAQKVSINVMTCMTSNFNWTEVAKAEAAGFDWNTFPHEEEDITPIDTEPMEVKNEDIIRTEDTLTVDIAASVEIITPVLPPDDDILTAVNNIKEDDLKTTENLKEALKKLDTEALLPKVNEIGKLVANQSNLEKGYLVQSEEGARFVKREDYVPGTATTISGAMYADEKEQKFVAGQIIHLAEQETFVAGQTVETEYGKRFVPGQTVVTKGGFIKFIPGKTVRTEDGDETFVIGHMVDSRDKKPRFVPGQMVDRGDRNPVFMSGQTVLTEDGPKFVPGEVGLDEDGFEEFVPGIKMKTSEGEKFVPGQAFQEDGKLSFTPGQIITTVEGPSFVPGTTFKDNEGKRIFVRGEMKAEEGKIKFDKKICIPTIVEDLVIRNEDLQVVAFKGKGIVGFAVKPSNTANVEAGERLYGDIVETEKSVLFYLAGKLPIEVTIDAKVIAGELIVELDSQRFIPGKILNTSNGEKFIPGQLVRTNHGEEFVPGQIVETSDGPKFVPGQLVMTVEGEKFVPGQVIMEEEGPKFVPGQIINTKNGATFIPGQMMNTDEGQKFVPGQLVDTKDGPRFVPGQVIDTNEGPKFVPGTIIETEDGLKYVPNSTYESEEDSEISFQGFDVSPEEIDLLSANLPDTRAHSPITKQQSLIDSDTLKKLAVDTMVIHGRTPEPTTEKKKKKKKGRVTVDALDEDSQDEESEQVDYGTQKIDVLNHLIKAATALSTVKKDKEIQKINEITGCNGDFDTYHKAQIEALKYLLSTGRNDADLINVFVGEDEQLISDILFSIRNTETLQRNDEVQTLVRSCLQDIVTKRCDKQLSRLINKIKENPESLFADPQVQVLLTEAVGVVCVTGDVEVASLLEKFISEPNDPDTLKDNKDVAAVLRQLLVIHRIAENDQEVAKVLHELQSDPEGVKDRNRVRKLIRKAKSFLKTEKSGERHFDIKHVTSSKDIPTKVFEQIKEDKKEAEKFIQELPDELFRAIMDDERCGGKFLESLESSKSEQTSKDLEKFKKGMAIVITKENMQAVIPRHFARSVCYGIIPYVLIDEEGFKFFERGLTGRKLAPSRVIENTWFRPDSYYSRSTYPKWVTTSGMQYSMVLLGDSYRRNEPSSLQYTYLLPTSGPRKISYTDAQRRASREGSTTSLRRSVTPSRRFSTSSIHDYVASGPESHSRRNSISSLPVDTAIELSSPYSRAANYIAASPYSLTDDIDSAPVARSGTVGRLLDKYSKYSVAKEMGYHNPVGAHNKYRTGSSLEPEVEDENDDDELTEVEKSYLPSRYLHRTPTTTDNSDKEDTYSDSATKGFRTYQRPFSDIYEADEADTLEKPLTYSNNVGSGYSRYSRYLDNDDIDAENETNTKSPKYKSSYDHLLNDDNDELEIGRRPYSSSVAGRRSKYSGITDTKTESSEDDDEDDCSPRKYHHNRYESSLTGEDDSNLYSSSSTKRYGSSSRNRYTPYSKRAGTLYETDKLDENDEDDDYPPTRKPRVPQMSQRYGAQDYDDFAKRRSARNASDRYPGSLVAKEKDVADDDDDLPYTRGTQPYKGSRSDTLSTGSRFSSDAGLGRRTGYEGYAVPNYRTNAGYNSEYGYKGDNENTVLGRPYSPYAGRFNVGYGTPYGLRGYDNDTSYLNQPRHTASYGPAGGYGAHYGTVPSMSAYGMPRVRAYGGMPYGLSERRFTTALPHLDGSCDDEDLENYDPKKTQRSLASQIAKKYNLDDSEGD